MPLGTDDYDVVIGVKVSDQTGPGSASVRNSINKQTEDIRKYGDKQAREFGRTSRDIFSQTDRGVTRSSSDMVRRLTHIFDSHNFLLRNMARQAGSTTGAIAIGVGKLALSYNKFGKDTEDASHRGRVALMDLKTAVGRLGTDPNAFPAAIKATKDLSLAYQGMGKTAHASSLKAGAALEESIHKRVVTLQGGLLKAQDGFERLRARGTLASESLGRKVNDISASVTHLLGGAKVDAPFFRSFIKARNETEKYLLVLNQLGPKAAVAYAGNQVAIEKLSSAFVRLESRATRSVKLQSDKFHEASVKVTNYKNELALLEKTLSGVAGSSGETAAATSLMSSGVVAAGIAIGATLAVVLLIIAAFVALTVITIKGAHAAAKYGDEIYKLSLSTGLTVKTLSALSVIAKETNTDVDSLAKTFTRTQIQVQRGLDKPFSEAGRALRTLKVNFQELRKANPDQQVFTLAKAFTELNNQNVRATVSQQLFSRDAERQAKMLEQVANGFTQAQIKAKKFGLELDEFGAVKAHIATVAAVDLKLAWEGLWISVGNKVLPQLTLLTESFMEMILKTGGAFEVLGGMANFVLRGIRIHLEEIRSEGILGSIWNIITFDNEPRRKAIAKIDKEDVERTKEYIRRADELRRRGIQGDDQYAAGRGSGSEKDRLAQQIKRLRLEIRELQDIGSKRFKLRFDLEELQKVKSGFEAIFKLRNEMGLTMEQPVPQFRIFGTSEEQQQDLDNLKSYVRQMERMKSIFEGVRKVSNEQADAFAELARVQQEALMPVVDAGTLAEIKYQTAIRDRAKAEKELTADVISESKLRKDAIEDEVGATLKAYMSLQRDFGRSQDSTRTQRIQDDLFVKIIRGDLDAEQEIRNSLKERIGSTAVPTVPTELMTIAAHAATIDLNVASIAEKIGANVRNVSTSNVSSPGSQVGYAVSKLVVRNADGTVTVVAEQDLNVDTIKSNTTDPGFLRKRIFDESRQRAGGERSTEVRKANQSIIDDEMRMEQALVDIDTDYLRNYRAMQVSRRSEARTTQVSIMLLENDLKDLNDVNSNLYKRSWEEADKERLDSHRALKVDIINIQNDIANNGFDQSDREKKAHLQAIRDVQEASNQARESIIYNQVKISDATIYHAEIADAKVMDFLANQRSITDVIADAKVGVIDTTFSAIDMGLDKVTRKLGLVGNVVKDLLSGFIRLALSPFFKALYGPQGGGGGGIPGLPGIFGGGGGGGNSGIGFTGSGGSLSNSDIASYFGGGDNRAATPDSITSGNRSLSQIAAMAQGNFGGSGGSLFSALSKASPLLGLTLGAGIGSSFGRGHSPLASILGAVGLGGVGLVVGTALPSILSGTFAGLTALGFATLGIGAGLAVAAFIIGKNKQRQAEEKINNQAHLDTLPAIYALLNEARTGDITVSQAKLEWERIHQDYLSKISTIKDSKTKRNALLWWDHISGTSVDPGGRTVALWPMILAAAEESEGRANIRNRMSPVFASGGTSHYSQWIKYRPGEGIQYPGMQTVETLGGKDRGYDSQYMFVPKGTRILSRAQMQNASPFIMGGVAGQNSGQGNLPDLHIDSFELNLDADGLASVVISSRQFKKAVINNVRIGKVERKL